ncbi:MAG: hypothetical protein IPF44_06995 [Betaproteobacteria bacterium]|nr:hypothetical protein [Betaproteobacteria bacterium]
MDGTSDKGGKTVVENWFERQLPQISGKTVNLGAGDYHFRPQFPVTETQSQLPQVKTLFCSIGRLREPWRVPARSTPWQINLSNDGRWVVAALAMVPCAGTGTGWR